MRKKILLRILLIITLLSFSVPAFGAGNPPSATTQAASSIASNQATLNGNVTSVGDGTVTDRGFQYGTTNSYGTTVNTATDSDFIGSDAIDQQNYGNLISGVVEDSSGFSYVIDYDTYLNCSFGPCNTSIVRKLNSSGNQVSSFGVNAWCINVCTNGNFTDPSAMTIDSSDKIYISEGLNTPARIQTFDTSGNHISDIDLSGVGFITAMVVDSSGNIYVKDSATPTFNVIKKFSSTGTFITSWGSAGTGNSQFNFDSSSIQGMAIDSSNNIYIADVNNSRIQKFNSSGTYLTQWSASGRTIAVDSSGNILVGSSTIEKYSSTGTSLGTFSSTANTYGRLAAGPSGKVYAALGSVLTIMNSSGTVIAKKAPFTPPDGIYNSSRNVKTDSSGNIYLTDRGFGRIVKYDSAGVFVANIGTEGIGDGELDSPTYFDIDSTGNIYVIDSGNRRVQKFNSSGTYVAKWDAIGSGDGQFTTPYAITISDTDEIYIYDSAATRIQKFNTSGTFQAKWGSSGSGDSQFIAGHGALDTDSTGNVYVADTGNHRIQKFDSSGNFISKWGTNGSSPGQFISPLSIFINASNSIYVGDTQYQYYNDVYNSRIQIFDTNGVSLSDNNVSDTWPIYSIAQASNGKLIVGDQLGEPKELNYPTGYNTGAFNEVASNLLCETTYYFRAYATNEFGVSYGSEQNFQTASCQLDVTINQKSGQSDPTYNSAATFTAVFSDPIDDSTFTTSDVTLSGTAPGKNVVSIIEVAPNDGTTFEVTASASGEGTIIADIPASSVGYSTAILGTTASSPRDIAIDTSRNVYTANTGNNTVSKITPGGVSTTLASTGNTPVAIAIDSSGNLYTSNFSSDNVSKITPGGTSTILAATGNGPYDIKVDSSGNIYTPNYYDNNVSKITPGGVSTILGTTGASPFSIAIDSSGNVYTANYADNNVSKITPAGVSTILGATASGPTGIAVDSSGNVYTANNGNNSVTKITPAGVSTTFANTNFATPEDIAIDASDNIFVSNGSSFNGNHWITKITPGGTTSVAGYSGNSPTGMTFDSDGNIYVSNQNANSVSKFTLTHSGIADLDDNYNLVSTSSDNTVTIDTTRPSVTINQKSGQADPSNNASAVFTAVFNQAVIPGTFTTADILLTGTATGKSVSLVTEVAPNDGTTFEITTTATTSGTIIANIPVGIESHTSSVHGSVGSGAEGITIDSSGNIYVANYSDDTVSKITPSGVSSQLGTTGDGPKGIKVDSSGNVYTSNYNDSTVTKITPGGVSSTLGSTGLGPHSLALDSNNNVYTANRSANTVTKITPGGVSTQFGTTGNSPIDIAIDSSNNIYTTNNSSQTVTKITSGGSSSTLGTTGSSPYGISVDASGNVYVANANDSTVTKITPGGVSSIYGTTGIAPNDLVFDNFGNLYVSNDSSNTVTRISTNGTSTTFGTTGSVPYGITIDVSGNIYTANHGGDANVSKISSIANWTGITDLTGNGNFASSSSDNTVTLDTIPAPDAFITTWKTDNPGNVDDRTITIPTYSGETYNYSVDWGDGNTTTGETGDATHTYASTGTYTVQISGTFPRIYFNGNASTGDRYKILTVEQWGDNQWTSMDKSFYGAQYLDINASDNPDLTNVTDMGYMFMMTDMNNDISDWDVSNVTNMAYMFYGASNFNQPLNAWDVSNVTDMHEMFNQADYFNQPLNLWDTGSVTTMQNMFQNATSFNGAIGTWDMTNVNNVWGMFIRASSFNQPIEDWVFPNLTSMQMMFSEATSFNQPLEGWDMSNISVLNCMFDGATSFNQPLNNWDTSSVGGTACMFMGATAFNQPLNNWDMSGVNSLTNMFNGATSFDQSLASWDVSNVTSMSNMLSGVIISAVNYDATLTSWSALTLQNNVTFDAGSSSYCLAATDRANIISTYTWTITDGGSDCSDYQFITTWKTDNPGNVDDKTITIPTYPGETYNYDVDWGDGNTSTGQTGDATHTYASTGTYTVKIMGTFPRIYFALGGDKEKILTVEHWGNIQWTSMALAFAGVSDLTFNASDNPDLSNVTNMTEMLNGATNFNSDISDWDTSNVTNMTAMFYEAESFNQALNNWDTSNVTDMYIMFLGATNFNQPLNNWDVSNVTDMSFMFTYASNFNQPLNNWDVSNVTDMSYMFSKATSFNQALDSWDVSNVTSMRWMFETASSFNQALDSWDVSNVTDILGMFDSAIVFNQALNNWDVSNITEMQWMFENASNFNQPLNNWDVSNVTKMTNMFYIAESFNQDISSWDTSNVTDMSNMFYWANDFDKALSSWDVSNVTNMSNMFGNGSGLSTFNYDATINSWNALTLQNGVTFDAGISTFCTSSTQRSNIISTSGWTINDGGENCTPTEITMPGDGTEEFPYLISDCFELQQMSLAPTASYYLINNIDCSTTSSWNSGQGFEPIVSYEGDFFDGRNFTISDLNINRAGPNVGLFGSIENDTIVRNVKIENASIINSSNNGSTARSGILAGDNTGDIYHVETSGILFGDGTTGGVVGFNFGSVRKSSSSASIDSIGTGSNIFGGLIGYTSGYVTDSFATGNITISTALSNTYMCGGLIGQTSFNPTIISNTYATGNISCDYTSTFGSGGLIGNTFNGVDLSHSFATGNIDSGTSTYTGGLIGVTDGSDYLESAYDATTTNQAQCTSTTSDACMKINIGNSEPNYFKNNETNVPLSLFNFDDIWLTTNSYPLLQPGKTTPNKATNQLATPNFSSADLSWLAPIDDGGYPIEDYLIEYKESTSDIWIRELEYHTDFPTAFVPNLEVGLSYDFRIAASNELGVGLWTDAFSTTIIETIDDELIGSGTPEDPYEITTCQNLQKIIYYPAASYVLTNDVDCSDTINWNSGKGFIPIGNFTGEYFDGRNHTILDMYINVAGNSGASLFYTIGAQSTLKNTKFNGGSLIATGVESFVNLGAATIASGLFGTLNNVHSNIDLFGTNIITMGGLASVISGGTVTQSSYTGNITATGTLELYAGGIAGATTNGGVTDSYTSSSIILENDTGNINMCGGLVGLLTNSFVERSYAVGDITCPPLESLYVSGGFVGESFESTVENSFSAVSIVRTEDSLEGSFIGGSSNNQLNNDYFDITLAQSNECSEIDTGLCTGVNPGLTQPDYFKNNTTSAPLDTWDFDNVWYQNSSYPLLRNGIITPDAPKNLIPTNASTSVDLAWEAPDYDGGSAITDYEIEYRLNGNTNWAVWNDGTNTSTNETVTGLQIGENYIFRVRAVNEAGSGLWTDTTIRTRIEITIEEPVETQFEYGDSIEYNIIIENNTLNTYNGFDTSFNPNGFEIDSINLQNPSSGTPPTNLGTLTGQEHWSGLLEPNQEFIFEVQGTINGNPNESGGLSFVATNLTQPNTIPCPSNCSEIKVNSPRYEIINSQTDFRLVTTMQEQDEVSNGDTVHLKYTITNLGPKTGFFTNSAAYIFFPPEIDILSIENDLLVCAAPISISNNLSSGIFTNLSSNKLSLCTAGNSALLQTDDSFDINVVATANTNFVYSDIVSRSILIAEQDVDNTSLNSALSANVSQNNTIFSSPINNISVLQYLFNNGATTTTTTTPVTTSPVVPTTSPSETPSSDGKTTGSKSGSTTPKTKIINKSQIVALQTAKNGGINDIGSYEGLPQVKELLQGIEDASKQNISLSNYKSKDDNTFTLFWLMVIVAAALLAISIRQAQQNSKSKKKLTSD